jgi:hypothetical protein
MRRDSPVRQYSNRSWAQQVGNLAALAQVGMLDIMPCQGRYIDGISDSWREKQALTNQAQLANSSQLLSDTVETNQSSDVRDQA